MLAEEVPLTCPECDAKSTGFVPGREAETVRYACGHRYADVAAVVPTKATQRKGRVPVLGVLAVAGLTLSVMWGLGAIGPVPDHSVAPLAGNDAYAFTITNSAGQDIAYRLRIDGTLACEGFLKDGWVADNWARCTSPVRYDGGVHRLTMVIDYENGRQRQITDNIQQSRVDLVIGSVGVSTDDSVG